MVKVNCTSQKEIH